MEQGSFPVTLSNPSDAKCTIAHYMHLLSSNDCPTANRVGSSVLFVDDHTDTVVAKDMTNLEERAQR